MLTCITGFSPDGWELYGERMVRTFDLRWPAGVDLAIFFDEVAPDITSSKRDIQWIPYRDVPKWLGFLGKWRPEPWAKGLVESSVWRAKERAAGYSYRTDALKFGRVPFAVEWFCRELAETEYVFWLDGDTVYFRDVPEDVVDVLMRGADVSFLGRPASYPEIGFQGYRLPAALPFLAGWVGLYEADDFRSRTETHSAYLFGEALNLRHGGRMENLTPDGKGHAWIKSPLVTFSDHLKGATRKVAGYSPEHPFKGEVRNA